MNFFSKLLIILLLPFSLFAQNNYKTGYVVTLKGDTVRGFINYKDWDSNPVSISFKKQLDDKAVEQYTVNEISSFALPGKVGYQKYTGPVSMDETNLSRIGSLRDTSSRNERVFLKVLEKGKNLVLYQYIDEIKSRYFIREVAVASPTELFYRVHNNADELGGKIIEEQTYKRQLYVLGNKYNVTANDFSKSIEDAAYTESDLLAVVSTINAISKEEFKKKYSGNNKVRFYAGASASSSKTSSPASSSYSKQGGVATTSTFPAILIGVNLFGDPNTGRTQFRAEFGVTPVRFNALYQSNYFPYTQYRASFNDLTISFTPQVIYNFFNSDNFKFYGGAGISVTYYSYSNIFYGEQDEKVTRYGKFEYGLNEFLLPFLFKAGIQLHKNWEIFVNYVTPAPVTNRGFFVLNQDKKQIGVSYFFK